MLQWAIARLTTMLPKGNFSTIEISTIHSESCAIIMKVETCSYTLLHVKRLTKWLACEVACYRQTYYCWTFVLYAELQSLALLNDINYFAYELFFRNWIIGISLMLYNKNSGSFCWQSVKGCDNVKKPTEYRKYFLCTVLATASYCSHRLLQEMMRCFWDTLQWPNMLRVVLQISH